MTKTKMKRVTEQEGLTGIGPARRDGEPYARTLAAVGMNGAQHGLAWWRGKHAGWIDAVLILRELGMPGASRKLQKHFCLNDEGDIVSS